MTTITHKENLIRQIAEDSLRAAAAELNKQANKIRMGEQWSSNPDNVKPKLTIVKG